MNITPDSLGLTPLTLRAIDQMSPDVAGEWLAWVESVIASLPPIKQRAGRMPDLRTGMQDTSVMARLWLQMARTDLAEKCRPKKLVPTVVRARRRRGWGCRWVKVRARTRTDVGTGSAP